MAAGIDDKRFVNLTTAVGSDCHLQRMSGSEELGRPFRYEIVLLREENIANLDDQVGQSMTVTVTDLDGKKRLFHGIVSQMGYIGRIAHYNVYSAILRPRVWFLTHSSQNRVFQNKTAVEIVRDVLDEHGVPYKLSLTETYEIRTYCVQYNESDFNFISRLLEEEGIYYFFEHRESEHDLVLADSISAHQPLPDADKNLVYRLYGDAQESLQHISEWQWAQRVETDKFLVRGYDYEAPTASVKGTHNLSSHYGYKGSQQYDYVHDLQLDSRRKPEGMKKRAKTRLEEQHVNHAVITGRSNSHVTRCGYLFDLAEHPVEAQDGEYLVIGADCEIENSPLEFSEDAEQSFSCGFTAISKTTPFRTARTTPKSLVRGPITAVVVGKQGEEIWTDEYGRVKVQFHWDLDDQKNENSSCWVRVSTALAGQNFGFVAIPRIGQEVIVDFLQGDPDQPIITGSVYNASNMPPYELPANRTQSGLKTRSSKDGGEGNFNELRFEDKKGEEEVFFHAEKNFNRVVKNNDTLTVGLATKDKGNQTIEIHNDRTATLNEGTDKLTVKKGDQIIEINNDRTATLNKGTDKLTVKEGNQNIEITKGDQTLDIKDGNQTIDVKKKITIDAGDELSITVGQASLVMKKNGDVTIKGKSLTFKGTNSVTVKGTSKVDISGAQVKVAGSAKTDVTGATTKVEGSALLDLKAGGAAKLKGAVTMIG